MPVFQKLVAPAARTIVAPRPYMRPTYTPPPRVITHYEPGRTVYRDRVVPGPTVTRNFYNTTYVNRGFSPEQRQAFERGVREREFERLMREGRWSREQAQAQASALAAQQAQVAAQQAAAASQASAIQSQSAYLQPTSQSPTAQSNAVSPGSAEADLGPTQDQAAADAGGGGDDSGPKPHHMLLIGGVIVAGVIGVVVFKNRKKKAKSASAD